MTREHPRDQVASLPVTFEIDRTSLLVAVPGTATLASIESAVSAEGLTLNVPASETTVADWLARGAPGSTSAFADPADHLVAGLTATLRNGERIEVRAAPRRAVGPDLLALFIGAGARFGSIDRVWLRVHRAAARRVAIPVSISDLDEPLSTEETSLIAAIDRELARR